MFTQGRYSRPDVQTAFGLLEARPPSSSNIFSGLNRSGAMGASDARIIAVVQGVIGDVVLADVIPHLLSRPVRNGVDLDQLKLRVPLHLPG